MRWATVLIEAGQVPFEHSRRAASRAQGNRQKEARSGSERQQEESAEKRSEEPPASSEENLLLFLVKLSDVPRVVRQERLIPERTDGLLQELAILGRHGTTLPPARKAVQVAVMPGAEPTRLTTWRRGGRVSS
jgi:hypothetical protein